MAINQNPASIVITDIEGNIEYVNPKFCQVSGYSREELIGKNPRILKSEYTSSDLYKDLWETIYGDEIWKGEFINKRKDGELFYELASISSVKNRNGEIVNFLAIKEDITEQQLKEKERLRQSAFINSLFNSLPDIIFFKNTDGVYMECNPQFADFVGKPKSEIIGRSDFDLFDKKTATTFRAGQTHTFFVIYI